MGRLGMLAHPEGKRELEAEGQGIGMADSLVAGIVRRRRGVLLTRNRRHFERVRGLQLSLDPTPS